MLIYVLEWFFLPKLILQISVRSDLYFCNSGLLSVILDLNELNEIVLGQHEVLLLALLQVLTWNRNNIEKIRLFVSVNCPNRDQRSFDRKIALVLIYSETLDKCPFFFLKIKPVVESNLATDHSCKISP